MSVQQEIQQRLQQQFAPLHFEVANESHQHSVPADSETHFRVVIVSEAFDGKRKVVDRERFACADTRKIAEYFAGLGEFQVVVEATAAYEWFLQLVEPYAERVVLAHPKKLRVIAESTRKTDKIDAQILSEFLLLDMIPKERQVAIVGAMEELTNLLNPSNLAFQKLLQRCRCGVPDGTTDVNQS